MVVVGEKESTDRTVAARNFHSKAQNTVALHDFVRDLAAEVAERRLPPSLPQ